MFYHYDLLCYAKKGKFAVIWLAGNHKKLSQKQIMSVNVEVSSTEIINTVKTSSENRKKRFSLYLSSVLMNGLCIIKNRQCELLLDQVMDWFMSQMAAKTLHEDLSVRLTISSERPRVKRKRRKTEEASEDVLAQALDKLQEYPSLPPSHYPEPVEREISLQPEQTPIVPTPPQPERTPIVPKVQTQEKTIMSLPHVGEDDDEIMQKLDKIFGQEEEGKEEQRLPVDEGVLLPSESSTAHPDVQGLSRTTTDKAPSMEVIRHQETPTAVTIFGDGEQTTMPQDERSSSISFPQLAPPPLQILEELPIQPPEEEVPAPVDDAHARKARAEPEDESVTPPRKRRKLPLLFTRDRQTELIPTRQIPRAEYEDVMSTWMERAIPDEPFKNFLPLSEDEMLRGLSDTPDRFQLTISHRTSSDRSRESRGKISVAGEKQMLHAPPELYAISEEAATITESAVMQESVIPELQREEKPREEESLQVAVPDTEPVPAVTDFPPTKEPDVRHVRDVQEEKAEVMEVDVAVDLPLVKKRQEEVSDLLERLTLIAGLSEEAYTFDELCPLSTAKSTAAYVFLNMLDLDNRGNIILDQDNSTDFAPIYIKSTEKL